MSVTAWPAGCALAGRPRTGRTGPDRGMGGRSLILGPGQEEPDADGFATVRSTTGQVAFC
jgi:hypothetical protein